MISAFIPGSLLCTWRSARQRGVTSCPKFLPELLLANLCRLTTDAPGIADDTLQRRLAIVAAAQPEENGDAANGTSDCEPNHDLTHALLHRSAVRDARRITRPAM